MNQDTRNAPSRVSAEGLLDRLVESAARRIIDHLAEDVSPSTWQRNIDYAAERFGRVSMGPGGREWPAVSTPAPASDPEATSGSETGSARDSVAEPARHPAVAVTTARRRRPAQRPARAARTDPSAAAPSATDHTGQSTAGRLDLLNVQEFAAYARLSSAQTVRNRLRQARLIGWNNARGVFVLPAGQLNSQKKPLRGLADVIAVFGNGHATWHWLTTGVLENGRTPLDELQSGGFRVVEAAARTVAPSSTGPTASATP